VFNRGPAAEPMILEDNDQFVRGSSRRADIVPGKPIRFLLLPVIHKRNGQVVPRGFYDYFMLADPSILRKALLLPGGRGFPPDSGPETCWE